ncbi:hypothetical protein VNO80_33809 [Phaseolus coccineus]|uniref:Uncharacterized protein n=1 Tax=Phaseolus coccineus TaxID=3886 RepID=A0AAN9KY38_PHACN
MASRSDQGSGLHRSTDKGLRSIGPPLRIYDQLTKQNRKGFGLAWFMSIDEGSQIALDRRLVAWVRILHLR